MKQATKIRGSWRPKATARVADSAAIARQLVHLLRRDDLRLSTLRRYAKALDAELEIVGMLVDRSVERVELIDHPANHRSSVSRGVGWCRSASSKRLNWLCRSRPPDDAIARSR
jgi:hypothetical protein